MSTEAEIAWAAGLFEGEGCFTTQKQQNPKYVMIAARLHMTDEDVVRRFHKVVGVGYVNGPYRHGGLGKKPAWIWATQKTDEVIAVYKMLSPWLGERRRARGAEVIAIRRAAMEALKA